MTDEEFFNKLAKQHYYPKIGEVADELGVSEEEMIAKLKELSDKCEIASIVWDEPEASHDLSPEDLPTIRTAFGK